MKPQDIELMIEAKDFLLSQGYSEAVTYPDKTTVNPTFQWITVVRLMEEYAQLKLSASIDEKDKEIEYWEQRCKAAEAVIESYDSHDSVYKFDAFYWKWKELISLEKMKS